MRHLSSIVKINRETGDVMWILGGKQNGFTFINEHAANAPTYFSYQHNVSVLPNGNITLFDNGNQRTPSYSRGVEYKLDMQNMTATLVWEYRHTPDISTNAMGSVERLPNGNTIIGWGQLPAGSTDPVFTEVHPDNSTALEFFLPAGQFSYRSYNYQWVSQTPAASATIEVLQYNTYKFNSLNDTTGITIKFDQLNSYPYADAIVSRYNYAPVNPKFKTTAPLIVSNYFNITSLGILSYTGEVQVNLYNYPAITNPKGTIVYTRSSSDSNFVPLPTSFDSTNNKLTFTTSTFGDFAFGIPQIIDSAYVPVPLSPTDSEIVNEQAPVKLVWGTRGIVQTYHLQISTNASFSNLVVDNSSLSSTNFTLSSVNNNSTYYWRINNTNTAGTSNWSTVESFTTAAPFIKFLSPNGSGKIYLDSTYVIRWESNIKDTINIDLMNGNTTVLVIGDTIVSGTNAFLWQVPSTIKQDSSYKIIITSISNKSLSDESTYLFIVRSGVTGVNNVTNNTISEYSLSQNYPNPFNPSTTIRYGLPTRSTVRLVIYNVLGQVVNELVNTEQQAGFQSVLWNANVASGMYFYRLEATSIDNPSLRFVETKKMLLLK